MFGWHHQLDGHEFEQAPVFLPVKSNGQRSLAGYNPWGCKTVRHDLATKTTNKNNNLYLLLNTEYSNPYLLPNTLKYNFFILIHLILHKIS